MPIIGHTKQVTYLNKILESDMLAHAYIFSGVPHLGKRTIASAFAAAIINQESVLQEDIDNATKSLCTVLEPQKETKKGVLKKKPIDIEMIRKAQEKISLHPGKGKRRVLLIDEAEKMTAQAQNALLKTLEEPSADTVIMLVTAHYDVLLPTILSRCEMHMFHTISREDLCAWYVSKGKNEGDGTVDLAMGRPRILLQLMEDQELMQKMREYKTSLKTLEEKTILERIQLGEALSKNVPETIRMFEYWIDLLRSRGLSDVKYCKSSYRSIEILSRGIEVLKSSHAQPRLLIENVLLAL